MALSVVGPEGLSYTPVNKAGDTMSGDLSVPNLYLDAGFGSATKVYGCRAWVNFNGTGTVAIRASGNVSSITDLGTGQYGINFTTAMPDANYCVAFAASYITGVGSGVPMIQKAGYTTAQSRVEVGIGATNYDSEQCHVSIFR